MHFDALLCSNTGQVFIKIPAGHGPPQLVPLKSTTFRNWLIATFHANHGFFPRFSAIRQAIRSIQAKAADYPPVSIALRVAATPGRVLIDLHNQAGEAIAITPHGWSVTSNHTAHFRTTRSARPLPTPLCTTGTIDDLRILLGLTPADFTRCLSWLVAALSPTGPYPILVIDAPVAAILRALIDPGVAPFCPSPNSNRDLDSLIAHNWIIALDHIDLLPRSILRKLIALSTGRPMIFTTESMLPPDLRGSAIHVQEASNAPSQEIFHRLRPQFLAELCNTVVANTTPPWQTFINVPDPVAVAVAKHLHTNSKWTGTVTELLLHLRAIDPATPWPATPKGLTQRLRRTPLQDITFQSHKGSRGLRSITLEKITTSKSCADAPHPP